MWWHGCGKDDLPLSLTNWGRWERWPSPSPAEAVGKESPASHLSSTVEPTGLTGLRVSRVDTESTGEPVLPPNLPQGSTSEGEMSLPPTPTPLHLW